MGNKKNAVWIVEIFTNEEKHTLLKEYAFSTAAKIAYYDHRGDNMLDPTTSLYGGSL